MSPRQPSFPLRGVAALHHQSHKPARRFHNLVKHRLHVRGRAADDAEHLGRRRLMLQRLAQFRVAFLDFFEQPHVLDSDDGLVGKGFEKSNLFLREGTNSGAANQISRRSDALSQQRRGKDGTSAETLRDRLDHRGTRLPISADRDRERGSCADRARLGLRTNLG